MRLLVLEDDAPLAAAYARRLRTDGFAVDEAHTLGEARTVLGEGAYDCLVFDRVLPDGDALELMADLGNDPDRPPVLMLSGALVEPQHRVEGLEAGADGYLSKPVRLDELAVLVRRLTARVPTEARPRTIELGRVRFDRARREVFVDGRLVHLSPTQFAVFAYLVENMDRLVPIEELLEHCWDRNRDLLANPAHSQITRLRQIFAGALRFESVRGVGYAIRVETDPEPA